MTRPPASTAGAARQFVLGLLLALGCAACGACPPAWAEVPPERDDALYASGTCGEVFVEADARQIALTRAARRLADRLGLDVELRLSVVDADGRLFVEARTADGPTDALNGLELVDEIVCGRQTWVLLRLPRRG